MSVLYNCKIGTYNGGCRFKCDRRFCCAPAGTCSFMGAPVSEGGTAPELKERGKVKLKREPKWFEKYYRTRPV